MTNHDDFLAFWSVYPRKVAKLEALKAWKQMTREYDPADIIAGLRRNLAGLERRERQFIPHPASWLRAGRWMDEPEFDRRAPAITGNGLMDAMLRVGRVQ